MIHLYTQKEIDKWAQALANRGGLYNLPRLRLRPNPIRFPVPLCGADSGSPVAQRALSSDGGVCPVCSLLAHTDQEPTYTVELISRADSDGEVYLEVECTKTGVRRLDLYSRHKNVIRDIVNQTT